MSIVCMTMGKAAPHSLCPQNTESENFKKLIRRNSFQYVEFRMLCVGIKETGAK